MGGLYRRASYFYAMSDGFDFKQEAQDYPLICEALQYLGENWQARPDYKKAAMEAGLSPHHFHRVFTRWAGLSPKKFVDAIAHNAARSVLDDGGTIEDASYEVGLSAPSRLHDLFVRFEALSPGEAKSKAKGVDFVWGVADSPFGSAISLESPRGLSAYAFADRGEENAAFEDLAARYPLANFSRDDAKARAITRTIFSGGILPVALYGTDFQRQVWQALLNVQAGAPQEYGQIARRIGRPKAARAVGAAIGANPVSWVIPCHRILGKDSRLTGYHWRPERKRTMLAFEDARAA